MNKFVGENLKALRMAHGLETGEASGVLGVSEAMYLAYEESREMPSLDVLKRAGEFYGVVPADLFGKMDIGQIDRLKVEPKTAAIAASAHKSNTDIQQKSSNNVADKALGQGDKSINGVLLAADNANKVNGATADNVNAVSSLDTTDGSGVNASEVKTDGVTAANLNVNSANNSFSTAGGVNNPKAARKASPKAFDIAILALSALCALITVGYFFEIGKYSVNISTASDMVISGYETITSYNYFNLMGLSTPCLVLGILLLAVILWDIVDSILLLSVKDLRRGTYIKISKIIRLVTGIVSTLAMMLFLGAAAQKIGAIVKAMEEVEGFKYVIQELDGFGYFSVFVVALLVVKAVAFAKVKPNKSEGDENIIKSLNSGDVVGVDATIKQTSRQIEEKSIIN